MVLIERRNAARAPPVCIALPCIVLPCIALTRLALFDFGSEILSREYLLQQLQRLETVAFGMLSSFL